MRFCVERSSVFNDEVAPCNGCYKEECIVYPTWRGGKEGKKEKWFIEIDSLNSLMDLIYDEGPIIIFPEDEGWGVKGRPTIEIYDGYRE